MASDHPGFWGAMWGKHHAHLEAWRSLELGRGWWFQSLTSAGTVDCRPTCFSWPGRGVIASTSPKICALPKMTSHSLKEADSRRHIASSKRISAKRQVLLKSLALLCYFFLGVSNIRWTCPCSLCRGEEQQTWQWQIKSPFQGVWKCYICGIHMYIYIYIMRMYIYID